MSNRFFKGLSSFGAEADMSSARNDLLNETFANLDEDKMKQVQNFGLEERVNNQLEHDRAERQAVLQQMLADMRSSAPFLGGPPGWV